MEYLQTGLKKVFSEISDRVTLNDAKKAEKEVMNIFHEIPPHTLIAYYDTYISKDESDSTLTVKENFIQAVLQGMGPTACEAYLDHPDRDVRRIAQSLAYGSPVKSVRFDE